jgi:hypothetical protein
MPMIYYNNGFGIITMQAEVSCGERTAFWLPPVALEITLKIPLVVPW